MLQVTPPAVECVAPEKLQSLEVVLKGNGKKVFQVLDEMRRIEPKLDLALSPKEDAGPERAVIIRFGPSDPYRKIGGLIYTAQLRGVSVVTIAYRPPLCTDIGK